MEKCSVLALNSKLIVWSFDTQRVRKKPTPIIKYRGSRTFFLYIYYCFICVQTHLVNKALYKERLDVLNFFKL